MSKKVRGREVGVVVEGVAPCSGSTEQTCTTLKDGGWDMALEGEEDNGRRRDRLSILSTALEFIITKKKKIFARIFIIYYFLSNIIKAGGSVYFSTYIYIP